MTLKLVSAKTVPVTLALAKRFRDMTPLSGERPRKALRAKRHAKLIAEGNFFTPVWGECQFNGTTYRGNGQHTSYLITAILQKDDPDEKSSEFIASCLLSPGGEWVGEPKELPLEEGKVTALHEKFTAEDEDDLIEFFRRYDSKESTRSMSELLGIHVGKFNDLNGLDKKRIGYALSGVRRAAGFNPDGFGFESKSEGVIYQGSESGMFLKHPKVREAVRWIVETVPEESLYSKAPGAQVFAELWASYGPEEGESIINEIVRQIENEEEPAASWEANLNKKRNRPTSDSLIKKGRQVIKAAAEAVLESV